MVKTYSYTTRTEFMRAKRARRRRRLIRVWRARIIFFAVIAIIVFAVGFLIKGLIASAHSARGEVISLEAEKQWAEPTTTVTKLVIQQETQEFMQEEQEEKFAEVEIGETVVEVPVTTLAPMPEPRLSAYEAGEVYYYHFSDEDKVYMAKTVYKEARGESFEGQVAVAAVIINRYFSSNTFFHRESIYAVVTQKWQFASIADVTDEKLAEYPCCMEAVEAACKGWDPTRKTFEEGACYFFELNGLSDYQRRIRTGIEELVIGNHHFHNDFNMDEVNKK